MENTAITLPDSPAAIARLIYADWKPVHYAAAPYLQAMVSLPSIDATYAEDSGRSIVRYFLSNARSWRGPTAKHIKAHLNKLANS